MTAQKLPHTHTFTPIQVRTKLPLPYHFYLYFLFIRRRCCCCFNFVKGHIISGHILNMFNKTIERKTIYEKNTEQREKSVCSKRNGLHCHSRIYSILTLYLRSISPVHTRLLMLFFSLISFILNFGLWPIQPYSFVLLLWLCALCSLSTFFSSLHFLFIFFSTLLISVSSFFFLLCVQFRFNIV